MLTLRALRENPNLLKELGQTDFLLPAEGGEQIIRESVEDVRPSTMVFAHETIAMMKADRTEQLERLSAVVSDAQELLPLKKRDSSPWEHITLGRATTADVVVADPAVSSVHAYFALDVDAHPVCVKDVGSSNGTFVNRQQLQPHQLAKLCTGDCLRFGQTIYYYISGEALREMVEQV